MILDFRNERDWQQFHTVKNLFVSLSLETAELFELAQWKTDTEVQNLKMDPEFKKQAGGECADIMIYLILISHELGINLFEEVRQKVELNDQRYPADKVRGRSTKYTDL